MWREAIASGRLLPCPVLLQPSIASSSGQASIASPVPRPSFTRLTGPAGPGRSQPLASAALPCGLSSLALGHLLSPHPATVSSQASLALPGPRPALTASPLQWPDFIRLSRARLHCAACTLIGTIATVRATANIGLSMGWTFSHRGRSAASLKVPGGNTVKSSSRRPPRR